jgi:hypothetical protein
MNNIVSTILKQSLAARQLADRHRVMLKRTGLTLCMSLLLIAVCATKCPDVGAECNPTGNPIGGGPGYSDSLTSWDVIVSTEQQLISALGSAGVGDTIYVDDNAIIDLTGNEDICIPSGVTLASGRGRLLGDTVSWGALLFTDDVSDNDLVLFRPLANSRITGLRVRGPYWYREGRSCETSFSNSNNSYCFQIWQSGVEVDNCELWGWSHSAVYFSSSLGYVHHNYIHEAQNCGQGLGVAVGYSGDAIIEANLFDFVRENIASVGDTNSSWEARYNIGLEHAAEHNFDRHGWPFDGDFGGKTTLIHHNTSRNFGNLTAAKGKSVRIRGLPAECGVYNNWFYASDSSSAIALWNGDTNSSIQDNQYGMIPPAAIIAKLPVAVAHADIDSGAIPLTVKFTGAGSFDPDGELVWYEWDFGDNTSAVRRATTDYTFSNIGVYHVRLTVHDNDGIPESDCIDIIAVPPSDSFYISAWVNDRYHRSVTGLFCKQLLIDDNVVWQDDVAACEGWVHVIKNVTELVKDRDSVTVACRLLCTQDYLAGSMSEMQTYWDDISLFWGDVKNGNFETGTGQSAAYWNYSENNDFFHGSLTSGDVRSGDRAYNLFLYAENSCNAQQYCQISQRVAVGKMSIPHVNRQTRFYPVYPNPSLEKIFISYQNSLPGNISVKVYDDNGRLVKTLIDSRQEPGFYKVIWDGSDDNGRFAANGVYFCKFIASPVGEGEEYSEMKKVVLLK